MTIQGMRKLHGIKVRRYDDHMIDIDEYLDVLPGAKKTEKSCVTKLYKSLLNRMPNSCSKQAYMQVFGCE